MNQPTNKWKRIISLCLTLLMMVSMFPVSETHAGETRDEHHHDEETYVMETRLELVPETEPVIERETVPPASDDIQTAAVALLSESGEIVDSGTCGDNLTWVLDDAGTLTISGMGEMEDYGVYYTGHTNSPWDVYRKEILHVDIVEGVTSIGDCAFYECTNLNSVTLPEHLIDVGQLTFYNCTSLAEVTIPNGVTSIGWMIFSGCDNMTSITIPNSVTTIGTMAFEDCSSLTGVILPDNVTSIAREAFSGCKSLASFGIPDSVTQIGQGAFSGCTSLSEIIIPESVTSISDWTFNYCIGLTSVTIPESVTSIGNSAFSHCTSLTSITIPERVTSIGNSAFYHCTSLTGITIPGSVTSIGSGAFMQCISLTNIEIPESVMNIGDKAFKECTALTSLGIPDGVVRIGEETFYGCTNLSDVNISKGVTTIGLRAFSGCSALDSIVIPDGVTSIETRAFENCIGLLDITIPSSVTSIGKSVFEGCTGIANVSIANGVTNIGERMFSGCSSLIRLEIPDSVTRIGTEAFYNCTGLTDVVLPKHLGGISKGVFRNCSNLTSIKIPDSVTYIQDVAFCGCESITSIVIPSGVTYINNGSFQDCSSLVHVAIPEGVTQIGEYAFAYCTSLNRIMLPDSLTHIGKTAFRDCDSLTRITIPDDVTYIGDWAFCDCESLKSITIPETITRIRSYTFYCCNSLNDVYYGGSKEEWDAVEISIHNESLNSATIHYNSTDPEEAPAYRLEVYTQDNTFSVQEDDATHFDVYLLENGSELYDWNCPAVTIADESVCTYTIEQIDSKYRVNITGKSIGQTLITITDSATGATIDVPMTVVYNLDGVNSYLLDDVPKFYPNSNIDGHLLTNFYNHRGLYINNFTSYYVEKTDSYHISMNAYNSNYYHGAIDVYDASGELYRCYQIEKFSDVSSFKDMGEYLIHFMDNAENPLAYDSGTVGKETKLEFDVPAGGFFTISNNVRTSMGAFLYNMCDMMLFGLTMTLDIADTHTNMGKDLTEEIFERVATDKAFQGAILDLMWELNGNMMGDYVKKAEAVNSMEDTLDAFYDILKSYMSIETVLAGILGIEEAVLTNLGGPAAWGVKTIFTASEYNSYILQMSCMVFAPNTAPIVISCRTSGRSDSLFGVKVIGNLPENSILQVNPVVGLGLDEIIDAYMELETERAVSRYDFTAFSVQVIADNRIHILEAPVQVVIPSDEDAERIVGVLHKQDDGAWKRIDYQIVDGEVVLTANSMGRFAIIYEAEPAVLLGDINGDGKINGKDGILLAQYLAEWEVTINIDAADVNGDGKVNGKDGVLLAQYLAEWDVVLNKQGGQL